MSFQTETFPISIAVIELRAPWVKEIPEDAEGTSTKPCAKVCATW